MKYSFLKENREKNITIPISDKGVNLLNRAADLKDGQLAECLNIWNKNGKIKTRPAFTAKPEHIIGNDVFSGALNQSYKLTDTEVVFEGKYCRIAISQTFYDESHCIIYVYLVGEDCDITPIGNMIFSRLSDDIFYIPEKLNFYCGASQNGGGIYALVSLVNCENFKERIYKIFEIDEEFSYWQESINYYIPTVYINGRGNRYEMAKLENTAFSAAPMELEMLNLLDGSFYAYFTSDSYSSSFRLPFSQISNNTVTCRVYKSATEYVEWIVGAGESSVKEKLGDELVEMEVNRDKGIVSFYVDDSDYAIPQMYRYAENNIRILAKKDITDGPEKIISCEKSVAINSKIIVTGGIEKNKIYYTFYDNPLYFPQIPDNSVGEADRQITAIIPFENRIIAFKDSEIYSIEIKNGKQLNKTVLLTDNSGFFNKPDSFLVKCIKRNIGCKNKATVCSFGGGIFWQGFDDKIYSFFGNSVKSVSNLIMPYINRLSDQEIEKGVATFLDNYYILCFSNKAIIMEFKSNEEVAWYIWEFPKECNIIGAFSMDKPIFICENENNVCFAAILGEGRDCIIDLNNSENVKDFNIKTIIKTKNFSLTKLGDKAKITKIFLELLAEGATKINIVSGQNICEFTLDETDIHSKNSELLKLVTNLKAENFVQIVLESETPITFGKAEVCYTKSY